MQQAVRDLSSASGADGKELQKAAQRNLQLLYLRRARLRLMEAEAHIGRSGVTQQTTKEAEDALSDVQKAVELGSFEHKPELGYAQCLGSLAGAQANQFKAARDLIAKAKDNGCDLVAPYNRLGTELLSVFVQYRASTAPLQREALLRTLPRLQSKATGSDAATLQKVLRAMLYSTNLALAYDYHLMGRSKLVGPTLRNAQKVMPQRAENDEDVVLSHNLAVADIVEGKPSGEKVLERLAPNPPESLVNLGILHDRRGEAKKALDFYKRAAEKGARTAKLREWIDTKDRMIGSGQSQ
jgi:tetratricopeptide (TPR) repeat protein